MAKKGFFLFRILKKIFITGFVNILPTLLLISIIVIAYNFLEKNLGRPINLLIKSQLQGNWKQVAIQYLRIDENLFQPVQLETLDELVGRVEKESARFQVAKLEFEKAEADYQKTVRPLEEKKEKTTDPDYRKYLEDKIEKINEETGFEKAKKRFQIERIELEKEIRREKEIRSKEENRELLRINKLTEEIEKKYPEALGILLAFLIIFFVGMIFTTFAGRSLKRLWEGTLESLPLVRKIYPYTKQLTEFLFQEKKLPDFQRVVVLEYPRKGIFSIGFPTGEGFLDLKQSKGYRNLVSVFIPSSPTPFTGYTVQVEEKELIPIDISVEEAIRFCITGGVIKPDDEKTLPNQEETQQEGESQHAQPNDQGNL